MSFSQWFRNVTVDATLGDNQTDIIYSVFVNGIPVWAVIAADDMKFMRRDEVAEILGMSVAIVAERMCTILYESLWH